VPGKGKAHSSPSRSESMSWSRVAPTLQEGPWVAQRFSAAISIAVTGGFKPLRCISEFSNRPQPADLQTT